MLGLLSLTIILYHLTWGQIHGKRRKRNSFRPSPTESKSSLRRCVEERHAAEVPENIPPHGRVRKHKMNNTVRRRRRRSSVSSTDRNDSNRHSKLHDDNNNHIDIDSIDIGHALALAIIWATAGVDAESELDDDHKRHTDHGSAKSEDAGKSVMTPRTTRKTDPESVIDEQKSTNEDDMMLNDRCSVVDPLATGKDPNSGQSVEENGSTGYVELEVNGNDSTIDSSATIRKDPSNSGANHGRIPSDIGTSATSSTSGSKFLKEKPRVFEQKNSKYKPEMMIPDGSTAVDPDPGVSRSGLSVDENRSTGKVEVKINRNEWKIKDSATVKNDLSDSGANYYHKNPTDIITTSTIEGSSSDSCSKFNEENSIGTGEVKRLTDSERIIASSTTYQATLKFESKSKVVDIDSPVPVTPSSSSTVNSRYISQLDFTSERQWSGKDEVCTNEDGSSVATSVQTGNESNETTTDRMRSAGDAEMGINHKNTSFTNDHKQPHRDNRQGVVSEERTSLVTFAKDVSILESTGDQEDKDSSNKSGVAMAFADDNDSSTNSEIVLNDVSINGGTNEGIKIVPYEELVDILGLNLNAGEENNASIKDLSNEGFCKPDEPYNYGALQEAASNLKLSAPVRPSRRKARGGNSETVKLSNVESNINKRPVASPSQVYKSSSWGETLPRSRKSFSLSSIRRKLKSVFSGKDKNDTRPLTEFEDDD